MAIFNSEPHIRAPRWFAYPNANPFRDLINAFVWQGAHLTDSGDGEVALGPINDYRLLSVEVMLRLLRCGCDVYNYDCFIVVPAELYDCPVPHYLQRPKMETWRRWRDSHHFHQRSGTLYYVATNSSDGGFLPPTTLADLCADGFTLITKPELQALQARLEVVQAEQ